ncbi:hypothetical protein ETAA8_52540 [Anatilimnocola aggregata]|uniref:Uncharacterized protein n=1 Tax=Anatilimnocola aggregata TaxID=2528021 RepID=A0A517YIU8_9BACT|nr:hypothetical protein [Anatilimnocola aggregata]QDU30135.1 hypothetical protein ETAA8_52540 [Anatilimnocola aggregata]
MNPLELNATLRLASARSTWDVRPVTNTLPVKELSRLIADIRRSRACFADSEESTDQPATLENVIGCDPRD